MNSSVWKEVQNRGSVVNTRKSAVSKEQKSVANPTNRKTKKEKNNNVRRRQKPSGSRRAKKLTAAHGQAKARQQLPWSFWLLASAFHSI